MASVDKTGCLSFRITVGKPDGPLLVTDGREDRVVDSFQLEREKKEKFLNGLIVWAGLIATAAFAAFITLPGPPALGLAEDGSSLPYDVETSPAGGGINRRNQVQSAFKVYIYSVAAAFFLSSSAILCQLIDYMHGERLLAALLRLPLVNKAVLAVTSLVPNCIKKLVHWQRSIWFMCGLASMVTYAGLALGLAFLSAGYVSFGRHESEYSIHWKVISVVGYSIYAVFTFFWLCLLLAYIIAPNNFLGQEGGQAGRKEVEAATEALLRYLAQQQQQMAAAAQVAQPPSGECSKDSLGSR